MADAVLLDEDVVARRAAAVLSRLCGLGVREGDRVAVIAGNGPGFVAARDAATAARLVLAPVNPRLAPKEIEWIVGHARPRAVMVDEAHAACIPAGAPAIFLDDAEETLGAFPRGQIGATLLYTSGTTGHPKGCWRTAEQERARADELRATYDLRADDVHLIVCPLAHSAPGPCTPCATTFSSSALDGRSKRRIEYRRLSGRSPPPRTSITSWPG